MIKKNERQMRRWEDEREYILIFEKKLKVLVEQVKSKDEILRKGK